MFTVIFCRKLLGICLKLFPRHDDVNNITERNKMNAKFYPEGKGGLKSGQFAFI